MKPTKVTLAKAIDDWLAGRLNLRPAARRSYVDSLALVKARLGHVQLQNLTKAHLADLVTELGDSGRRVGNVQRTGLSPRSINLMLTLLGSVLDAAAQDGLVARNVARQVERPKQTRREMQTWTADRPAGSWGLWPPTGWPRPGSSPLRPAAWRDPRAVLVRCGS